MALPSAVQKIADEGAAFEAQMKEGAPAPAAAAPAIPPADPSPAPTPAPVAPENYKERYSRYKASTDQTISDLRQQIDALNVTVTNLNARLSTPTPAPAPDTSAADKAEADYKAWLKMIMPDEKEQADYEDSFLRMQFRQFQAAKKVAAPAKPDTGLTDDIKQLKEDGALTKRQLFEERMDRAFPNDGWVIAADTPGWAEFLNGEAGEFDSRTRGEILNADLAANNSYGVTKMVNAWKRHSADPKATPTPDPLAAHLTPDDAGGGGTPTDPNAQAPTFTESQVDQIYADKTKKMYTPEEFAVLEKQIEAAYRAGTVAPG